MSLQKVLHKVEIIETFGDLSSEVSINAVVFDSREVVPNDLFVAQKGVAVDGHQFIQTAIEKGANVIVCEDLPVALEENLIYVKVKDSNIALAEIAANFYGNPSEQLKLVGVTGTNGKTTIASLLYQLFQKLGKVAGLLSTVKIMVGETQYKATHTTPDVVTINKYMAMMVEQGITHCFMEVSSHGIHQKRIHGLQFDVAVFTNLSHDHLDYHKTFAEYRDVKKQLFDGLSKNAVAIVNIDDKNGQIMLQNCKAKHIGYAVKKMADIKTRVIEKSFDGMLLKFNHQEVWTKLVGYFNAYNLSAIYGVATELGEEELEVLTALSQLESVDGRFEYQVNPEGIVTVVDYAHTPDALQNTIETIKDIKSTNGQLITVVGCGGNRDKDKRPVMGKIATDLSAQVIFTDDNPRNEDPIQILKEMELGVLDKNKAKFLTISDRTMAIKTACKLAKKGDVILVAGKGHENYQEIKGVKYYFSDQEVLREALNIQ